MSKAVKLKPIADLLKRMGIVPAKYTKERVESWLGDESDETVAVLALLIEKNIDKFKGQASKQPLANRIFPPYEPEKDWLLTSLISTARGATPQKVSEPQPVRQPKGLGYTLEQWKVDSKNGTATGPDLDMLLTKAIQDKDWPTVRFIYRDVLGPCRMFEYLNRVWDLKGDGYTGGTALDFLLEIDEQIREEARIG
jgi:hypothetical protein